MVFLIKRQDEVASLQTCLEFLKVATRGGEKLLFIGEHTSYVVK